MEEDDPVIEEIPVFLSQALTENLQIFQYPVRPGNRDWNEVKIANAAIKPKNNMVRLEIGLDTDSDTFCSSKGEQIAINTDGFQETSLIVNAKDKEKTPYFRNVVMDKIVYESSQPCTETDMYAVGILQDKEFHLTPIQSILQLRPAMSYFDKQDKRKTDKNKSNDSDDEEKEIEAQQVTVKFARQETEVAKKAREKSFKVISQRISEEPWHDSLYLHANTDHADLERLKLFSANSSDGSSLNLRGREYIRTLVPAPPDTEGDVSPRKKMSVPDQLRQILLSAKLMRFSDLTAIIQSEEGPVSESLLISHLSGAACCVRGLWTARSADLYTHSSPVPARLLCAARDHVLYLFTQHSYVDRRKVSAAVRLPPLEVEEIMRSVAKFNPNLGWELIIPPDTAFEAKYPDVIQRQNLYWEARQRQFNDMLIGENVPKRQRKKSQRESIGSDAMLSPKPRCNSVSEEDSDKKRVKNKGVGKRTRNFSSSSNHDGT